MAQESSVWKRLTRLLEQEPALAQQCQAAGNLEEALKLMQETGARLGIALGWTELAEVVQGKAGSALEDGALEQVAANLLLNALDAVEPGQGRITLSAAASPDGEQVSLTVADNGPGIPAVDLPHIFDPFFTTKEAGRGTGLGLAVAFGLMRDMGGTIEARNDGGAVFAFRFAL